MANPSATTYAGYHRFEGNGAPYGSFEVYWFDEDLDNDPDCDEGDEWPSGWYWCAGFPDCLPDGEPHGPFDSSADAVIDAMVE